MVKINPDKWRVVGYFDFWKPDIAKNIVKEVESYGKERCLIDIRIRAFELDKEGEKVEKVKDKFGSEEQKQEKRKEWRDLFRPMTE